MLSREVPRCLRLGQPTMELNKKNSTTRGGRLTEGFSSVAYHYLSPYHSAPLNHQRAIGWGRGRFLCHSPLLNGVFLRPFGLDYHSDVCYRVPV